MARPSPHAGRRALPIALVMVTPAFAIGLLAIIIWILVTSILLGAQASRPPEVATPEPLPT